MPRDLDRQLVNVGLAIAAGLIPEAALDLYGEATARRLRRLGDAVRYHGAATRALIRNVHEAQRAIASASETLAGLAALAAVPESPVEPAPSVPLRQEVTP
jgi:hypothetical protein